MGTTGEGDGCVAAPSNGPLSSPISLRVSLGLGQGTSLQPFPLPALSSSTFRTFGS